MPTSEISTMSINKWCRHWLFQVVLAMGLIGSAQQAAAADSVACRIAAGTCALSLRNTAVTCAAAAAQIGENPAFDGKCAFDSFGSALSCTSAAVQCDDTYSMNEPMTVSAGFRGSSANMTRQTLTCGNATTAYSSKLNRVVGVYAKRDTVYGLTLVSSIKLQCAEGVVVFLNNDGTDGGTWNGANCSDGKIAQGLVVRTGAFVDGVGRLCDQVGYSSDDSDNTHNGAYGGSGGNFAEMKCPENKYLWGLSVWYDATLPKDMRYAAGIEVLCRGYRS
jgi:hypothetical protein